MNYAMRMTIKTLAHIEIKEALDATAHDGSSELRQRVRKLSKQRLGEGQALLKLQALIERCRRATEERNDVVHSVVARELDGDFRRRHTDHKWQKLPTIAALEALAAQILELTKELNEARLEGFLAEALMKPLRRTSERGTYHPQT